MNPREDFTITETDQTGDIQNVKTLAATGHQEKALVGALSVIVKSSGCEL